MRQIVTGSVSMPTFEVAGRKVWQMQGLWKHRGSSALLTLAMMLGFFGVRTAHAAGVSAGPDPRTTQADAKHNRAVHVGGFTVYVDANGTTVTGANPEDAVLGWAPPATGRAHGPIHIEPSCLQPPAQHAPAAVIRDHASMSDAELQLYGMPTRAMIPDPVEWANDVRTDDTRICTWSDPYLDGAPVIRGDRVDSRTTSTVAPGAAGPPSAAGIGPDTVIPPGGGVLYYTTVTFNWAGWSAETPYNTQATYYRSAEGYFTVPSLGSPGHWFDDSGHWIGIGGVVYPGGQCSGNPSLVQAGGEVYTVDGSVARNLFFENVGDTSNCHARDLVANCAPWPACYSDGVYTGASHAGDRIYIVVGCGSTSSNCFYIKNTALNLFYSQQFGPNSDMRSGECISERGQTLTNEPLADFGSVYFDHCRVSVSSTPTGTPTEYGIGNIPGQTLDGNFYGGPFGTDTYCMSPSYPTSVDAWGPANFTITDNAPSFSDC